MTRSSPSSAPNRSSHTIEVGALAQRHGVPMITTSATNPGVTAAGDLIFVAAFTDQFEGRVMAEFAAGRSGCRRAAFDQPAGCIQRGDWGVLHPHGIRGIRGAIVADESYKRGARDFSVQLARIAAAKPGAVFVPGRAEEVALLSAQARALPVHDAAGQPALFLGADAWDNPRAAGQQGSRRGRQFLQRPLLAGHGRADGACIRRHPTGSVWDHAHGRRPGELRCGPVVSGGCGTGGQPRRRRGPAGDTGHPAVCRSHAHLPLQRRSPPDQECLIMTIENGVKRFYQQVDP